MSLVLVKEGSKGILKSKKSILNDIILIILLSMPGPGLAVRDSDDDAENRLRELL